MVNGFEIETSALSENELKIYVPLIVKTLKLTSDTLPVKNHELRNFLKYQFNVTITESRIRAMIHHIRIKKLVKNVLATSDGYFVSSDATKIMNYVESLKQRENSIREIRMSFDGVDHADVKTETDEQMNIFGTKSDAFKKVTK